jgi:hypothetical protein
MPTVCVAATLSTGTVSFSGRLRPTKEVEVLGLWTFGTFLWGMVAFFFWFVLIWMFIAAFADIFRRRDLSGWAKAGWILVIAALPLIGILIYVIARPSAQYVDYGGPIPAA